MEKDIILIAITEGMMDSLALGLETQIVGNIHIILPSELEMKLVEKLERKWAIEWGLIDGTEK